MRITFVVPVIEASGGARIIAGHAQRLKSRGHDVLIVAPSPRPPSFRERAKLLLGRGGTARGPYSHYLEADVPIRVVDRIGAIGPEDVPDADVIVATFWTTAEWIWPFPSYKGAKVHFIQHYEAFPEFPDHQDRVDAVWRLPTYKIAIAQWLVDLGRERFGIDHIALVPNSIDHHLFNLGQRLPRPEQRPTVGFLYHHAAFKDVRTSVAALQNLVNVMPDLKILSFGVCERAQAELPAGTEFVPFPTQQQIAGIYARCHAWLSTSRTEGFNLPPLEAMGTGCPAVCSKTGRPLEIISDGVNGYLVDPGDIAGFTDRLARILSCPPSEWDRMSEEAVRSVAHPTWSESSALFEEALLHSLATPTHT